MHLRQQLLTLRDRVANAVANFSLSPSYFGGLIDRLNAEREALRARQRAEHPEETALQILRNAREELPFTGADNLPALGRTTVEARPTAHSPFMVSPAPISALTTITSSMPTLLPIDISPITGGIGGAVGGSTGRAIGAIVGQVANTFLNPNQQSVSTGPTAGGSMVAMAGPMMPILSGAGGAMLTAARAILVKATMFVGKRVTLPAVLALVRRFGPTVAATALGLTLGEIIQLWISGSGKTRRRRGISGADLRRTTRTLRTLGRLNQLIGGYCGRGTGRRAVRSRSRK